MSFATSTAANTGRDTMDNILATKMLLTDPQFLGQCRPF